MAEDEITATYRSTDRWSSIDAIKGIACIGVIFIHVLFPEPLKMSVKSMSRFAVPIFFMTSGFFFIKKDTCSVEKTVKKFLHIAKILAYSGVFYFLFCLAYQFMRKPSWDISKYIIERCTAGRIVRFFITNDPFVYSHLWFLLALMYIYLFCMLAVSDGKRMKAALPAGIILLICYSLLQEFSGILGMKSSLCIPESDQRIYLFNLFLFRGLSFFLIGVGMKQHLEKIQARHIPAGIYGAVIVMGTAMSAFEYQWTNDTQYFVGNIIASLSLMLFALQNPNFGSRSLIHIGRDLSLYVYILHIAVRDSFNLLVSKLKISSVPTVQWIRPFCVVILTLLVSEAIFRMIRSRGEKM